MSAEYPVQQPTSWFTAPNPLLQALPKVDSLEDMYEALMFNPLAGIEIKCLSFADRDALLTGEKVPLEPTMQCVRAAMTWWGMLSTGLRARNPLLTENRINYWATLHATERECLTPPRPTKGMSINVCKGPPGTGKTVTQMRFCAFIPKQAVDLGRNEAAGWNSLRQLVYLCADIAHDGSRGGFLQGLLQQMDLALGTQYSLELPRRHRTVDKLALATIRSLVAHYCGILFIDEAQLRNLVQSGQADLMQMFLLLLMNSGIPLVLTGNERAFDWVTYSQDLSRLNLTTQSLFLPVGALNSSDSDDEWEAVALGVIGYYVLNGPAIEPETCKTLLRKLSGGIPRLALSLWCAAQRICLYDSRQSVTPNDLLMAYEATDFSSLRPLAEGFHFQKPELLAMYPDIDADFYRARWGAPAADAQEAATSDSRPTICPGPASPSSARKRVSEQSKFESEQTKKRNRGKKAKEKLDSLSPDDIRRQGLISHHLTGLAAAKAASERSNGGDR